MKQCGIQIETEKKKSRSFAGDISKRNDKIGKQRGGIYCIILKILFSNLAICKVSV